MQRYANVLWSMARMGLEFDSLAGDIEVRGKMYRDLIKEGDTQHISNVVWSMSKMMYDCPNLADGVGRRAEGIIERGKPNEIANIASSFAKLGYFDDRVFSQVARQSRKLCSSPSNTQCQCNVLYAFGVSGKMKEYEGFVKEIWDEVMSREERVGREERRQLELVRMFGRSEGVELKSKTEKMGRDMKMVAGTENPVSSWEFLVKRKLIDLGFRNFKTECSPFEGASGGGLLKLDIAWEKEKVAIELNGPSHYLTCLRTGDDTRMIENGKTKAKKRLLKSFGWKVLSVSYHAHRKESFYFKMYKESRKGDKTPAQVNNFWVRELEALGIYPVGKRKESVQ